MHGCLLHQQQPEQVGHVVCGKETEDYYAAAAAATCCWQAMERIHAILPDGTIVKDIEVFRCAGIHSTH
jgi:hypothetical protein